MTDTSDNTATVPSNPADLKKIRDMLEQAVTCEIRISAERDLKKDIVEEIHKKFGLKKKVIRRMVSTMHKHNFSEVSGEIDDFIFSYEKIVGV